MATTHQPVTTKLSLLEFGIRRTSIVHRCFLPLVACALLIFCSSRAALGVAYTWNAASGNWDAASNWTPGGGPPGSVVGDTGLIDSNEATINAALSNSPDITVTDGASLFWSTLAGPATGGTITVQNGGILQYNGNTTNATDVLLEDGARLGRLQPWTSVTTSADDFTIADGATVAADVIRAHVPPSSSQRFQLTGSLSGIAGTTLEVKPGLYTAPPATSGGQGEFRIAPTSPNSFAGDVEVSGLSAVEGQRGILAVAGEGALANVGNLNVLAHGTLRFGGGTDPFAPDKVINIATNGRVEWEGSTTYPVNAPNDLPTLVLDDGSQIGRYTNWTSTDTSLENISLVSGATVDAGYIRSHVPLASSQRLQLSGQISGDASTTILVKPNFYTADTFTANGGQGQLRIAPSSANPFLGTVQVEGLSATQYAILGLSGTGALANATLDIQDHSILLMADATDPFGTGAASVDFLGNSIILWDGASTYTTPATFNLVDGTRIGRYQNWTTPDTINETLSIADGATVYADFIRSHIPITASHRLQMSGELVGDNATTIVVTPNEFTADTLTGFGGQGEFRLNPSSPNSDFFGTIDVDGLSATQHAIIGLGGTGALVNGTLDLGDHVTLRIAEAVDPFGTSGGNLFVPGTNRVFWNGASSYTVTPLQLDLSDGVQLGRYQNWTSADTSRENLHLLTGATVRADAIRAHIPGHTSYRLDLRGPLSGDSTTTLVVEPGVYTAPPSTTGGQGALRIAPDDVGGNTGFAGHVLVNSLSSTAGEVGILELGGAAALGTGTLEAMPFSVVAVTTDGAMDGMTSVSLHEESILRFRRSAVSTLANTTLKGSGVVRAESTGGTSYFVDNGLQPLTLNNVVVAPGFSAGTLEFQTSQLTLGGGSVVQIEIGGLQQDLIEISGDLGLDASTTLEISALDEFLSTGLYPIITYTGSLGGTFGSIIDNLESGGPYLLLGVDYGVTIPGAISLNIFRVPEPGTASLLAAGLACGWHNRRRRRVRR